MKKLRKVALLLVICLFIGICGSISASALGASASSTNAFCSVNGNGTSAEARAWINGKTTSHNHNHSNSGTGYVLAEVGCGGSDQHINSAATGYVGSTNVYWAQWP